MSDNTVDLTRLADTLAIRALLDEYVMAVDSHDAERFADTFWDDGTYLSPFGEAVGRAAIIGTISQWHAGGVTAGTRHMRGPSRIVLDGNRASGEASYWVAEAAAAPPRIVATGGYSDTFEKRGGQWRLLHRAQTIDPSFSTGALQ